MVSQVLGVRPTRGRYRPIAELGRGGMATAYLCVAQGPGGFNKLQVLKYLRPDLAADEEFLTMFLEEARIAARIVAPVKEAADLGVRRISVGGSLARTAWSGFMHAAKEIAERAPSPISARDIPAAN